MSSQNERSSEFLSGENNSKSNRMISSILLDVGSSAIDNNERDLPDGYKEKIGRKEPLRKKPLIEIIDSEINDESRASPKQTADEKTPISPLRIPPSFGSETKSSSIKEPNFHDDDDDEPPPISLIDAARDASEILNDRIMDMSSPIGMPNSKIKEGPSLMEEMMDDAAKEGAKADAKKKLAEQKRANDMSFGKGLKKGFLNAASKEPKKLPKSKVVRTKKENEEPKQRERKPPNGFKKGFLNSNNKKKSTSVNKSVGKRYENSKKIAEKQSKKSEEICELDSQGNIEQCNEENEHDISPLSVPNNDKFSSGNLVMDEVQKAMMNNPLGGLGIGDELTSPELMEKISGNPRLAAGLSNPKFTAALEALQKNPKEALSKFKNHPEINDFLNEFCGVLGQHFTELGAQQYAKNEDRTACKGPLAKDAIKRDSEKRANGNDWNANTNKEDQDQVNKVLADKELYELLIDTELQHVIKECNAPDRMVYFAKHPKYGPKIRKLVDAGLLQVQS